ncbi:MAG: GTP 3',8-cyclase MoaA [Gammaproteobacteria bacterium]|nr:GTP 3',8-cyclase MoaA [Gammaproteobacteria bacterium]MDH5659902.1 GTP 3',8-cyclase MoaA [Gammaproteobacteria bacterium]
MTQQLTDKYGRRIEYVRLSVTDRCDLRCNYCMPEGFNDFEEPEDWLTFDEIERVIRIFGELGTKRIRLTGGEPLVRKNIPELAARLAALPGIDDLSISSNATRLRKQAAPLKQAGISRINISLDTLRADRFKKITGGKLEKVIDGLMAAKEAGFQPVKINMVVMRGVNDDEVEDMVQFCIDHDFTLRFIETMPMGNTGREASLQYIPLNEIHDRLAKKYNLLKANMNGGGPARYVRVAGTELRIGFITPMSQHFCDTCNRVRLSVDGTLYLCLGQEDNYPLREHLRSGITDEELKQHIQKAIDLKPEKHEFSDKPEKLVRFMSMTGG